MARFKSSQPLNAWVLMLHEVYGQSQNYSKTAFEIHAHLTEVSGMLGKLVLRKPDLPAARLFAAKVFAWAVALLARTRPTDLNLEDIILRKFPGVCSYCLGAPCKCWSGIKPDVDEKRVRDAFYNFAGTAKRAPNDFQLMFRRIYEESWQQNPALLSMIVSRLLRRSRSWQKPAGSSIFTPIILITS